MSQTTDDRNEWISYSEYRPLEGSTYLRQDSSCTSNIHAQRDLFILSQNFLCLLDSVLIQMLWFMHASWSSMAYCVCVKITTKTCTCKVTTISVGPPMGGGALPYLKMVWNFCPIDPRFWHFPIPLGIFLMPHSILLIPSFCRKNWVVSIAFSSRDNFI